MGTHPDNEPISKLQAPWESDEAVRARFEALTPNQQRIVRSMSPKARMMAMTAGWLLAANVAGLAGAPAAEAMPGIEIVNVSPAVQSFDGKVRSVISPDGDRINDAVAYTLLTEPGKVVQLTVNYWLVGQQHVVTLGPVKADAQGRATNIWAGKDANGQIVEDGGYNLTFCHPDNPGTALTTPALPPGHLVSQGLRCGCGVIDRIIAERRATSVAAGAVACGGEPDAIVKKRSLSVTTPGAMIRSVQRGSTATLNIDSDRADTFAVRLKTDDGTMTVRDYGQLPAGQSQLPIPASLQPGQYSVDVTDQAGAHRTTPLVVRARPSIEAARTILPRTVLAVSPSLTWRAYSFADADFDGFSDSWYTYAGQSGGANAVSLEKAYEHPGGSLQHGVDEGYWQVLREHPKWRVEAVTDYELGLMSQRDLNRYAAIVFPGHTEYYTQAMLDRVKVFRSSGGHTVFWAANDFYARVGIDEQLGVETMERRPIYTPSRGRDDFALKGNGYVFCCFADDAFSYQVGASSLRRFGWMFAGTGLRAGDSFGHLGSEIDTSFDRFSPKDRMEIAGQTIDYFDPNFNRQMAPRVSLLWLPPRRTRFMAQGAMMSAGSMSFLTAIARNDDPLDQARVKRIVANTQEYLAALPHPTKIKPRKARPRK
jgi:hypothetical protein